MIPAGRARIVFVAEPAVAAALVADLSGVNDASPSPPVGCPEHAISLETMSGNVNVVGAMAHFDDEGDRDAWLDDVAAAVAPYTSAVETHLYEHTCNHDTGAACSEVEI